MAGTLSVRDILDRVKRTFGDEAAVQITEADILRWINDAQREAVMQNEGLLQTVGYISSVAGQQEYDLPTDLYTLSHLYYRDTPVTAYYSLKWYPLREFTEYADGWDGSTVQSIPLVYGTQQTNKVILFPTPQASVANGIKLIYSKYAETIDGVSSPIELPPYLHSFIVNFCLMQAYEMDEDWESAQQKATQIQGDLDFNNNKKFWFGREQYPTISVSHEDQV